MIHIMKSTNTPNTKNKMQEKYDCITNIGDNGLFSDLSIEGIKSNSLFFDSLKTAHANDQDPDQYSFSGATVLKFRKLYHDHPAYDGIAYCDQDPDSFSGAAVPGSHQLSNHLFFPEPPNGIYDQYNGSFYSPTPETFTGELNRSLFDPFFGIKSYDGPKVFCPKKFSGPGEKALRALRVGDFQKFRHICERKGMNILEYRGIHGRNILNIAILTAHQSGNFQIITDLLNYTKKILTPESYKRFINLHTGYDSSYYAFPIKQMNLELIKFLIDKNISIPSRSILDAIFDQFQPPKQIKDLKITKTKKSNKSNKSSVKTVVKYPLELNKILEFLLCNSGINIKEYLNKSDDIRKDYGRLLFQPQIYFPIIKILECCDLYDPAFLSVIKLLVNHGYTFNSELGTDIKEMIEYSIVDKILNFISHLQKENERYIFTSKDISFINNIQSLILYIYKHIDIIDNIKKILNHEKVDQSIIKILNLKILRCHNFLLVVNIKKINHQVFSIFDILKHICDFI